MSYSETTNVLVRITPAAREKLKEMAKADRRAPVYTLSNLVENTYKKWKEQEASVK